MMKTVESLGKRNTPDARNPERVVIVDADLIGYFGHWYSYDKAVVSELRRRGIPVSLWVHSRANAALVEELEAEPVLTGSTQTFRAPGVGVLQRLTRSWTANRRFFREITALLRQAGRESPLLFLPNADLYQFPAIAAIVNRCRSARLLLLVREPVENEGTSAAIQSYKRAVLRLSLRAMAGAMASGRVRLCSDSGRIAAELHTLTQTTCRVLPIPHCFAAPPRAGAAEGPNEWLKVCCLGTPRPEKGADVLARTVTLLRSRADRFEFRIQTPIRGLGCDDLRAALTDCPNVVWLPSELSTEAYQREIEGADIAFLPYRAAIYRARTSGICLEAAAAGVPVVTTEDTWMADLVEQTHGGLTAPDGDAAAFSRALTGVATQLPYYRSAAAAASPGLAALHNPSTFVDHLLGLAVEAQRPQSKTPTARCAAKPA
jgi:hypothetical protein